MRHSLLGAVAEHSGGAGVIESRGIETTVAQVRSAERCTRRLVSECAPPWCRRCRRSASLPAPSRVSDPMSRRFTASVVPAPGSGRSVPMALGDVDLGDVRVELPDGERGAAEHDHEHPDEPDDSAHRRQRRAGRAWISRRLITRLRGTRRAGESWSVWPTSPSSVVLRVVCRPPGGSRRGF